MRLFRVARVSARAGICVLALASADVAAQEAPAPTAGSSSGAAPESQPASQADTVKPEPSAQVTPAPAGTSNLPELVVDSKKDEKKKTAKSKDKAKAATDASASANVQPEAPPPGVVLGTSAPSDTGTSTFDANNVQMRANGGGDANSFLRNLPNVQYQNNASTNAGTSAGDVLNTKPALMSISGGRTYENNFILNGVSISNITGAQDYAASNILKDNDTPNAANIYGMSPQNIYVPADFIGKATVIDSNASAEYGQFQGGVVVYDLAAPPTGRYQASVSASRETSRTASYILATPDGKNSLNVAPPAYDKTKLAASVGAPITKDFSFIAQASRQEANTSTPLVFPLIGDRAAQNSDNTFMRFAATARTDIGKFTFDTSYTHYFQNWDWYRGHNMVLDTDTSGTNSKLEYETKLAGLRVDSVGLGNVNLVSRAYYNTNETQNNSDSNYELIRSRQRLNKVGNTWTQAYLASSVGDGWCATVNPATYPLNGSAVWNCIEGGFGNQLQGQNDYGVDAKLTGNVLLGNFKLGAEVKQYEGHRARSEDFITGTSPFVIADDGKVYSTLLGNQVASVAGGIFHCAPGDMLCSEKEIFPSYSVSPKYDVTAVVNAIHNFAEIDQTWKWFNVRAGARLDYDDYFKNINIAPRLAGTVTPFEGVSFTGGVNRYYLGESLYYAIREKQPSQVNVRRTGVITPVDLPYLPDGTARAWAQPGTPVMYNYGRVADLNTPYSNEYTGAVGIRDPLLGGFVRLKYLERYKEDQFATASCGTLCYQVSNGGSSFYRSKSVEYTKQWDRLQNPFFLNGAAISGNATWDDQKTAHGTYLLNVDFNGDGYDDSSRRISYKGKSYRPEEFTEVTGNLDIPVRIGATLSTVWFDGLLELNGNAGINLGYQGVANTNKPDKVTDGCTAGAGCYKYEDINFGTTLKLDVSGRINVTEQAAIDFHVDNITNSTQNAVSYYDYPWVLGRTFWIGSTLKLQ